MMDHETKEYGRYNLSNSSASSDVFEPTSVNDAKLRTAVIEWLNSTLPNLNLPVNASDEELRTFLADGTILCRLMNKLRPGSVIECGSSEARSENVKKFLAAMDDMNLPHFNISELEKGSMKIVSECLLTLKAHFMPKVGVGSPNSTSSNNWGSNAVRWKQSDEQSGTSDGYQEDISPRRVQRALRSPVMSEPPNAMMYHAGHKFHEVFQMKHGGYSDLPASKISELMKSNSLDIAPTQSLLSMVNGILDESINRKNGEIPHVACLMRKFVQEIERRISTQAEYLRTQNNLFKTREEKYQSRIRVLEALANGNSGESKAGINHFDHMKMMMSPFDQIKSNGSVQNSVNALQDHLTPVEEAVGEPPKHTYASILQVAKGQSAPSAPREHPVTKSISPSDLNHVPEPPAQQSAAVSTVERSGAEAVEDTSVMEDEVEVKSVYVRNVPSTAIASDIEELFMKFGKIRQDGVAIRTRKDIDVCYAFVEFEDISGVHNAIKASTVDIAGQQVYIEGRRANKSSAYRGGRGRGRGRVGNQMDGRGRFGGRNYSRGNGQDGNDRDYTRPRGNGYYRQASRQDRTYSSSQQVSKNGHSSSD